MIDRLRQTDLVVPWNLRARRAPPIPPRTGSCACHHHGRRDLCGTRSGEGGEVDARKVRGGGWGAALPRRARSTRAGGRGAAAAGRGAAAGRRRPRCEQRPTRADATLPRPRGGRGAAGAPKTWARRAGGRAPSAHHQRALSLLPAPPRRPRPHGWAVRKGTQTPPTSPAAQLCRRAAVSAARCQAAGARARARTRRRPAIQRFWDPQRSRAWGRRGAARRRTCSATARPPAAHPLSPPAKRHSSRPRGCTRAAACAHARRRGEAPCTHWQPLRCR